MFDPGTEVLRKHLLDPLQFDRRREPQQRQLARSARFNLPNGGSHKQPRVLHDTLPHQRARPSLRHLTFQRAQITTHAKLVDEPGHDAAEQWIVTDWLYYNR